MKCCEKCEIGGGVGGLGEIWERIRELGKEKERGIEGFGKV